MMLRNNSYLLLVGETLCLEGDKVGALVGDVEDLVHLDGGVLVAPFRYQSHHLLVTSLEIL